MNRGLRWSLWSAAVSQCVPRLVGTNTPHPSRLRTPEDSPAGALCRWLPAAHALIFLVQGCRRACAVSHYAEWSRDVVEAPFGGLARSSKREGRGQAVGAAGRLPEPGERGASSSVACR
jgi:hypothetical protein